MELEFVALDGDGRVVRGSELCESEQALMRRLADRSLTPLSIRPVQTLRSRTWWHLGRSPHAGRAFSVVLRQLGELVSNGVSLMQSLDTIIGVEGKAPLGRQLVTVRRLIAEGVQAHVALRAAFPAMPSFIDGVVEAGERSGHLGAAFLYAADLLEFREAFRRRITSALAYPILIMVAALGSFVLFLTLVVPRFRDLAADMGSQPDRFGVLVFAVSDVVAVHGSLILVGAAVSLFLAAVVMRRPSARLVLDRIVLRAPYVGSLVTAWDCLNLARVSAMLLRGGVALPTALTVATGACANSAFRAVLDDAPDAVRAGVSLSDILGTSPFVQPELVAFVRVGEQTGRLADMLAKAADYLDSEVGRRTGRLLGVLPPALTLLMGCLVAGFIIVVLNTLLSAYNLSV